jgi:hypothetical protein
MCCGVLKTDLVLHLTPEEAAASLRQPHTSPMDFTGKPMKSMIYVSAMGTDSDEALVAWVESALKLAWSGTRQAPRARRITSSGSAVRGPAISKSASKRAARKRG